MKKIYVFDIDGTIKPMIGPMFKSTKKAIQQLAKRDDVYVALATGRTYDETKEIASQLGISYLVTSGGSDVYIKGKRVFSYQEDLSEELTQLKIKKPIHVIVSDDGIYSFHFPYFFKCFGWTKMFYSKISSPYHFINTFSKVQKISKIDHLKKIHKLLVFSKYPSDFKYHQMKFGFKSYEFEDKSLGVFHLCEILKDVSEVVCFGDSRNDLSLFRQANRSYAMKSGSAKLQSVATHTISMNEIATILKDE